MATSYYKIKFPCGLEIESSYSKYGVADYLTLNKIKGCPLHGKNCKEVMKK